MYNGMSITYMMLQVHINNEARNSSRTSRFRHALTGTTTLSTVCSARGTEGRNNQIMAILATYTPAAHRYISVKPYFNASMNDSGGPSTQARESMARIIELNITTSLDERSACSRARANSCGMAALAIAASKTPTVISTR